VYQRTNPFFFFFYHNSSQALEELRTQDRKQMRPTASPKSPLLPMGGNLVQKKNISPRDGLSPRIGHYSPLRTTSSFSNEDSLDKTSPPVSSSTLTTINTGSGTMGENSNKHIFSLIPCERTSSPRILPPRSGPSRSRLESPLQREMSLSGNTLAIDKRRTKPTLSIEIECSNAEPISSSPGRSDSAPKVTTLQSYRKNRNPGNLSLDLSQMDKVSFSADLSIDPPHDPTMYRRNEHAAQCSKVTDFLFIGGAAAAKNKEALDQNGITHIVNCAANVTPDYFPNDFLYYNVRLRDHSSQDIVHHFYSIFDFIEDARQNSGKIFVHCVKGISRSPTMAIAYLMWLKQIGMHKALEFVRQARPIVDPNAGFIFQLTEWEHLHREGRIDFKQPRVFRVEATPKLDDEHSTPSSSKVNRNNSASAGQPLIIGPLSFIKEKYFQDPSPDALKQSLVVSSEDCGFIWCGRDACQAQVDAAHQAVQLLQKFESFPSETEVVYHGQEGAKFWRLVASLGTDKE
jgi:predicted protein tyrosine phosphatase